MASHWTASHPISAVIYLFVLIFELVLRCGNRRARGEHGELHEQDVDPAQLESAKHMMTSYGMTSPAEAHRNFGRSDNG